MFSRDVTFFFCGVPVVVFGLVVVLLIAFFILVDRLLCWALTGRIGLEDDDRVIDIAFVTVF